MKVKDLIRILQQLEGVSDYDVELFDTSTGDSLAFHEGVDITHDPEKKKVYFEV